MNGDHYLDAVRRELDRLRRLAEDALAQVDDDGFFHVVGQIVQLARRLAGPAWKTLSIPRGGSSAFNRDPQPYLRI